MQQGYHQRRSRPAGELQLLSNENLLAKRDSEEYTKERNAEAPQYQLRNTEFQWPALRWLEELFQRWDHTNETCAEWHRAHRYGNRLKKDCGIGLVVGKTGEGGGGRGNTILDRRERELEVRCARPKYCEPDERGRHRHHRDPSRLTSKPIALAISPFLLLLPPPLV